MTKEINETKTETEETKKLNIYQKMLLIQTDLKTVGKNLSVGEGKSSYKAVSERDILDAVKQVEFKHGIYSYCYNREIIETKETTNQYGKVSYWQRFRCLYYFVNVDNPNQYLETVSYADGVDSNDKGSGKAMTYADKYALMKTYKISTGDDPDQQASEEQFKLPEQIAEEKLKETKIKDFKNAIMLASSNCKKLGVDLKSKENEILENAKIKTIDMSKLSVEELESLAKEMRRQLINAQDTGENK